MTEKKAREALLLKVQYTIINHDLAPVNEAIDALLAARTEAIVDSISIFSCTCARRIESEFSSTREPARPRETYEAAAQILAEVGL